jgi:peptide/nickel transport system permease protein
MAGPRRVISRSLLLIPLLIGVTLISFALGHAVPGEPTRILLRGVSPDAAAAIKAHYGLDQPLAAQYVIYIENLLQGDFGRSDIYGQPVLALVLDRLPMTLALIALASLLAFLGAVGLATLAAARADRGADRLITCYAVLARGVPAFWIGLELILLFGAVLQLLPLSGYGGDLVGRLMHLLLPALAIALTLVPALVGELRARLLDELDADHAHAARAQGAPERRIFRRHARRNALRPALVRLARRMGWLIGSAVLVEQAFALPGLGSLLIAGVIGRDYLVVQAAALIFALLVVASEFLAGLLAAAAPRARP